MRLTIARKLALGFGIMLILLMVSGAFSWVSLNQARAAAEELVASQAVRAASDGMMEGTLASMLEARHYVSSGDMQYLSRSAEAHHLMEGSLATVKTHRAGTLGAELRAVEEAHYELSDLLDEAVALYRANPDDVESITAKLNEADDHFSSTLVPRLEAVQDHEQTVLEETIESVRGLVQTMAVAAIVMTAIALIAGVGAAYVISRGITGAAGHLSTAAESISRGDLDVPIQVRTGDELEDLAASVERMRASLKAAIERLQRRAEEG